MKKLLSVLLVAAMLLGLAGTAFAATPTDVTGTTYETAVGRLSILGILTGYPDGSFKPANNITRAEFAAVAVRALGLDSTAKATVGATQFKDVPATHWAAGYINVAVGKGVIKGYPDGTFKPEANVTNAEAMAMLIRVLGYEPAVTGEWPMNYVSKAAEIGLNDGTNLAPNTAAIRGDVATLTSNSLTIGLMEQSYYGTLTSYQVTSKTLLTNKLGVTEVKGARVMNAAAYDRDTLKTNEVEVLKSGEVTNTTFTFASTADMNAMLGHKVDFWAKNGEIFNVVDKTAASKVVTVTVDTSVALQVNYTNAAGNAAHYDTVAAPTLFLNHATDAWAAGVMDPVNGIKTVATMILNDAGVADFIVAMQSDIVHFVTEVDTETPDISVKDQTDAEHALALDTINYNIVDANGAALTLSNVKVGDVVYIYTDANADLWIKDISNTVSGEVTKVTTTADATLSKYKVYVGTTAYSLNANPATFDGDNYAAITTANINSLVGTTGKFFLDAAGKIAVADTQAPVTTSTLAFVKKVAWDVGTSTGVTKYIQLKTIDGTTTSLPIASTVTIPGGAGTVGALVKYSLNDSGAIKSLTIPAATATSVVGTDATVDALNNRITVGAATFVVTADTKVFDATTAATVPVAGTWTAIEDVDACEVTVYANATFTGRADIIIVNDGALNVTTADYAALKYKYTDADGLHFVVDENGTEKDYVVDSAAAGAALARLQAFAYKDIGTLALNIGGEVTDVTELAGAAVTDTNIDAGKLDSTGGIVVFGANSYYKTSDTVVYDCTGSPVLGAWTDLKVGYNVTLYVTAGNIDVVVITSK